MKNSLYKLSRAVAAIRVAAIRSPSIRSPSIVRVAIVRVAIVTCALLFPVGSVAVQATTLTVDQNSRSAQEDGTAEAPFKTIQKAADAARAGDTVIVHGGAYRETVRPAHSGRAEAPITFRPFKNEIVTVSGADLVRGFRPAADGSFQAPMPADFFTSRIHQSDQIFVDGRMMNQARWPNTGFDVSRPAKAQVTKFISKTEDKATHWWTATFEDDHLQPQTDSYYNGAEIYVQPNRGAWSWTFSGRVVSQVGNRLTIQTRSGSGQDGQQDVYAVGSRYYLFNKRELLDAPGEWFHDTAAGTLILRYPDGRPLTGRTVEAKRRDFGFDLTERAYITVQGIRLFACTLTTDSASGGDAVPYNPNGTARYPWRPSDWVAPANHIVVDRLDAKYINHFTDVSGHFFFQWPTVTGIVIAGSDNVIRNCRVQFSAGNGISLQGLRHRCLNNLVLDTDYLSVDCAGISTGTSTMTRDVEIAHNTVRRTGRTGITLRALQNSDPARLVTRVHHNDVADFMMQDWDGGAFYMAGMDGKFVRIDHNWFHCDEPRTDEVFGAYWDYSKNYILDHNVIWGVPTPIQITYDFDPDGAKINNMLIYNNTATGNGAMWSSPIGAVRNNGSVLQNNIFRAASFQDPKGTLILRWPSYGNGAVTAQKNLVWGVPAKPGWTEGKPLPADLLAESAGFPSPARGDFHLGAGSPAVDAGVPLGPIVRDGITVPPFNDKPAGAGADLGAYERGGENWTVGSTLADTGSSTPAR